MWALRVPFDQDNLTPFGVAARKGVRLSWSNGTFSAHILAYIVPTEVQELAGSEDGLTTMSVVGTLVYDTVSAKSLRIVVNSDLAALP